MNPENIQEIFEKLTIGKKIQILRTYEDSSEPEIIGLIIKALDDNDIQVRGEAFSILVLNKNKISKFLINSLKDSSKNIRGYSALILANRNDIDASKNIIDLINDKSSMVRSCALGSIGHMKIKNMINEIRRCFLDSNLEVRKSALKAVIDVGGTISEEEHKILSIDSDEEMNFLFDSVIKDGPGGI